MLITSTVEICIYQLGRVEQMVRLTYYAGLLEAAETRVGILKSQTPLIRFVVDLLYKKLYNKSTTNPQQIWRLHKKVIVSPAVYPRFLKITELARSLCHS